MERGRYPGVPSDYTVKYPQLLDKDKRPWCSFTSSYEWNKVSKTLFITANELHRIHIPQSSIEFLTYGRSRVMIVESHVTGVWYPFLYEPGAGTLVTDLYFLRVDPTCPIEYVILERKV